MAEERGTRASDRVCSLASGSGLFREVAGVRTANKSVWAVMSGSLSGAEYRLRLCGSGQSPSLTTDELHLVPDEP